MWLNPGARLPEQVLTVRGTCGPWWPIHAVQQQQKQQQTAGTASPVLSLSPAVTLPRRRQPATPVHSHPRGPICRGVSSYFSNCCKDVGVGTKQPKGGGATRDLLLSGLPLSSDASSSAYLCSLTRLFHFSNLPKVSVLSFGVSSSWR